MFRFRLFLTDNFGNPAGVLAFLRVYGARQPNEATVAKWFVRGSIPSDWLPLLLGYLEVERGEPISIIKYIGEA
jgi:hypothetical protein